MPVLDLKRNAHCAIRLFFGFSLFASSACAGDIGLTITMSPDAARAIRDWRRANGLPQPPEAVEARTSTKEVELESTAKDRADALRASAIASTHAAKSGEMAGDRRALHVKGVDHLHRK